MYDKEKFYSVGNFSRTKKISKKTTAQEIPKRSSVFTRVRHTQYRIQKLKTRSIDPKIGLLIFV
jgi:hypothetical protein